jgi:hypothetical protein
MSIEITEIVNPDEILPVVETVVTEPVVSVEPIVEPVPEIKEYVYQPTDEQGRPLGGKQVLKYHTEEELRDKLQEQNVLLLRRLRAETRKNRLGISDTDEISDDAPRYAAPVDFAKPDLSPDDRVRIARELGIDPEKFDETTDAFFESTLGVKPEALRQTLRSLQDEALQSRARLESEAFVAGNKDYVKCKENFEAITNWMSRYNLAPVRENFQKAYDTLRAANVLIESAEVTPPVQPVVEPTPIVEPPPVEPTPQPVARIPTGLTRNSSADTGGAPRPLGDDIVYEYQPKDGLGKPVGEKRVFKGLAAIEAMPADVYKYRVLHEKGFAKKEEKLHAEAAERRNSARQ